MSDHLNVILIQIDSLNRHFLSCYGNDWVQAPNLATFAQKAAVFDNHLPCMPARRRGACRNGRRARISSFTTCRTRSRKQTWPPPGPKSCAGWKHCCANTAPAERTCGTDRPFTDLESTFHEQRHTTDENRSANCQFARTN
jgi:hypothetical protein